MHISRGLAKQIILFLIVGGTTLLIDLLVTLFCYHVLGLPAYFASAIGFLSGFFFNFPMNKKRVFKHDSDDRFRFVTQIVLYIALSVFNLIVTSFLAELIVMVGIDITIAKVFTTGLIAVWNFIIFRQFIFSKKPQSRSTSGSN